MFAEETETDLQKKTESEELSDYDKKLETLKYGLDTEVIALTENLKKNEDTRFNEELQKILAKSKNPKVKYAVMDLFSAQKNDAIRDDALKILSEFYDYKSEVVLASIKYCKELEITEASEHLRKIIKDDNSEYRVPAILTLGKLGNSEDAEFLVECFENESNPDSKISLITRQHIMEALMELHEEATWDFLLYTAEDSYENAIIRARAATALGKIGKPEAVNVLSKLYEDKDPAIREAAVKGLTNFSNEEAKAVLIEAFKDSYYKVRLQAVKSAEESKNQEAIPYILYRAKTDPEEVVKFAAIKALSASQDSKSLTWLKERFLEPKTGERMRIKIAGELLEYNFDFIVDDVNKTAMKALKDTRLKRFAINLGSRISKIENAASANLAEAYLMHSDPMVQSVGLDMFKTNSYAELIPKIQEIAAQKKNSAIKRRAKVLLELKNIPVKSNEDDVKGFEE